MALLDFLISHVESGGVSFHMPGHKGAALFRRFGLDSYIERLVDFDITEIPGADNLFKPEGSILELMDQYAERYGAKYTFLSVGGSSNGLIAAILAAVEGSVRGAGRVPSDKQTVLIARNSHKSVFYGARLSGANPVYVYPEIIEGWGIAGEVTSDAVERELSRGDDNIAAVVIASPNYYGVCSDIRAIAEVCHGYDLPLIVDQAHGAHLKFLEGGFAAENCGADVVVNSIHKTLASFTQTSIVNVCTDRIDKDLLAECLQMIQTSSPSYILLASMALNMEIIRKNIFTEWEENLNCFYDNADDVPGLHVFTHRLHDKSKILLDFSELGINGSELNNLLLDRGIIPELSDHKFVMAMSGIGNTKEDFDKLIFALKDISTRGGRGPQELNYTKNFVSNTDAPSLGEILYVDRCVKGYVPEPKNEKTSARKDYSNNTVETVEKVPLEESLGYIVAEAIIPYPPGIVLVAPGEVMDKTALSYLINMRKNGHTVLGVDGNGKVRIMSRFK